MSEKNTQVKDRKTLDIKYIWDLESMYPNEELWEKDFNSVEKLSEDFTKFSGHLGESAKVFTEAMLIKDSIYRNLEKVFCYAHMRKDENNKEDRYQAMMNRCQALIATTGAKMSFFAPEMLSLPKERLLGYLKEDSRLKIYDFAIRSALREKEHVLTTAEENLLAQVSEVLGAPDDIYSMFSNAEMKFGETKDEDGKNVELTHGNYIKFMESRNREVRKNAFTNMYEQYKKYINTIGTIYSYNVKTNVIGSRIRKYPSALEASLYGNKIPKSVYTNLIDIVNDNLPTLHKYINLKKELLGLDKLHMYDVYVPLFEVPKTEVTYENAKSKILDVLQILGEDYVGTVAKGLEERWVDLYETEGKTSGAYSFGSYDSKPFILMNFAGTLKDIFTLIHEMGHSLHAHYTRSSQPFVYGGHSIFTAEVASTVNENFLMKNLIENEKDSLMKKYLINYHIEEFRATLFRQTMFAEFELLAHEAVESGEVVTSQWLCDTYERLNSKYFGEAVDGDNLIRYEWARIPHFYNPFYVYQYATGYSAASAISDLIIDDSKKGGTKAREAYIEFLKSGDSNYPIELLKIAGVDMSTTEPIKRAMKVFEELVNQLEELVKTEE